MKKSILFYLLMFVSFAFAGGQVCENDSLALVALYDSTNGGGWTDNTNWLQPGNPVSTWYGITVYNDSVTVIDLQGNNLSGVLPPQIGNLNSLTSLDLNNNQLTGSIPKEIGNLSKLTTLSLYSNELTDSIPSEIGSLSSLLYLRLRSNDLTGHIPPEIGNLSNLVTLQLYSNELTGSIPPEIGNLSNLEYLQLNYNQLTGEIPAEIGNLTNLKIIYMNNNQLSDSIPVEISSLKLLQALEINNNKLTGSIPPEIGNMSSLKNLNLHHNQFTGSIPPEIGSLADLQYLYLENNQLTGSIPEEIDSLDNLIVFWTNNNQLSGAIPAQLNSMPAMTNLRIHNNCFTFADLAPLAGNTYAAFDYAPQCQVPVSLAKVNKSTGDELQLNITDIAVNEVSAVNNEYQWWKDAGDITSPSASPLLVISSLDEPDAGYYHCLMSNPDFPLLTLHTDSVLLVMNGPVDIILSPDDIEENVPPGTIVGGLTADDYDQPGGHTFAFAEGDGSNDEDNDLFTISGADLSINHSPDYETKQQYHIYVRAEDDDLKTFDKGLVIFVNDIFETGIKETTEDTWQVFPNPSDGVFYIAIEGSRYKDAIIEVINSSGEVVSRDIINNRIQKITLKHCPEGNYIIKLTNGENIYTKKVLIQ